MYTCNFLSSGYFRLENIFIQNILFVGDAKLLRLGEGSLPPRTLLHPCLSLKICIRRTTAVEKARVRSAQRKSRTNIFVSGQESSPFFFF